MTLVLGHLPPKGDRGRRSDGVENNFRQTEVWISVQTKNRRRKAALNALKVIFDQRSFLGLTAAGSTEDVTQRERLGAELYQDFSAAEAPAEEATCIEFV
jgi:hypothetical protein